MNKPLFRRLWIIAGVLLLFQGGAFFLLQRAKSSEVRPLTRNLSELPYDLGNWHGEDQKLNEETAKTVGARQSISRIYRNGSGRQISVHMGEWDSLKHPTLPHPPGICYPASGAEIIRQEEVEIGSTEPITASLLVVERQGVQSLVLYWYCWDKLVCTTRGEACLARLKMIGSREWPPVVKVLLDSPVGPSESEALTSVTELAAHIRELTRDL